MCSFKGLTYWHVFTTARGISSPGTIKRGRCKLIYYYEYDKYELFNLRNDISEEHDLSSMEPEIASSLLDELDAWTKDVDAPIPNVLNDKFDLQHSVRNEKFEMW